MLLALAPDFSQRLILPALDVAARRALQRDGACWIPASGPGERPYQLTRGFFDDAAAHGVLEAAPLPWSGPARILHGGCDREVPLVFTLWTAAALAAAEVRVTVAAAGDHRLSEPPQLHWLEA